CPGNMNVNSDPGNCGAIVNFNVTSTDNCSSSVSTSPASGTMFLVGTTTVTSTAVDAAGNTSTCTCTITVNDSELPFINCPADISVNADANDCSAVVNFNVTSTDNCTSTVISTPSSGSKFPVGTTKVNSVAVDASGNSSTCSFNITVTDNKAPVINCPAN